MPFAQRTVRDALRDETRTSVLVRLRRIMYLSVVGLVLSALSDFRLTPPPEDLMALKLVGAGLQGVGIALLVWVRNSTWSRAITASVAVWILTCATVAVNGSYTNDVMMPTFLLPVMIVGSAMLFPWGTTAQLVVALAGAGLLLPEVMTMGTNLIVSVYSAFAASILIAWTFERQFLERKAIELIQAGEQRVLERIAADASLDAVFVELLDALREQMPESMYAIMLLNRQEGQLCCVAETGLPEGYRQLIDRIDIGTGLAQCVATAAVSGQRMVTEDIAADERWTDVRALLLAHGLRASWSEPIRAADRTVLGVIGIYRPVPSTPSARELASLEAAARLLGIALERREARRRLERYVRALDDARLQAEAQSAELAEARDQALASMQARSQFLANMSHEIRTPLNGIIGTTEILLDTELTATQQEYAHILSQCGEHLLGVINDILDLSKIEARKMEIEHVDFDFRALVEEVGDVVAVRAQEKGIELVTSIPPALDVTVKGDPARLRQVLVNLVGNAIKFTDHGEVVIEAQMLYDSPTHCTVRLSVRDTGIGIPPERQAAVFESFTQGDGSTTRNYGGTGLGLTICRELVHLMGGAIGLDSAPGRGSTFWIDLPFERVPDAPPERAPLSVVLAGLRVLLVDDTAINRLFLRRSLQECGCRVEEAASGSDALALLEDRVARDPFGLAILDMHMPGLDGVATARRVKANPRLAAIPLILLSSIGGLAGGDRVAREIGLVAVITKPIHRSTLLQAVRRAVGAAGEPERDPRASAALLPAHQLRVLLAEDNPVNQLVARRALEKLGCQTEIVDNGRAAVEAVAGARYDVVLMDIQMPLLDGFEATAAIRGLEAAGQHLPIIAMTAHAMEGDRERCLGAGMDGYISKPVNLAALAEALATVASHAATASA